MEQRELISTGVADIASSLGFSNEPEPEADDTSPTVDDTPEATDDASAVAAPATGEGEAPVETPVETPVVTAKPAPKSWPKEMHPHWEKVPAEVQDYWERREKEMLDGLSQYREFHGIGKTMHDVLQPYRPMIQAAGLDEAKAVQSLFNAQYRLTNGSPEQRLAAYQQLGRELGFAPQQAGQQQMELPAEVRAALQEVEQLKQAMTQRERAEFQAREQQVKTQVETFAKDAPYFEDVAAEVVAFINAGDDLKTAYEKAVYANPVTRAKEMDRLQKEAEAKLKEKSKAEVEAAKRSTAANVRSRDTKRTPTEPLGKMEDTMKQTLKAIRERSH